MVDDVEKRWHDPGMFRRAVLYTVGVVVVAALVLVVIQTWATRREACAAAATYCDTASRAAIVGGPGLVLMLGTLGAFLATYRVWREHRTWPIWQGAGWFLLVLTLAYLAIGSSVFAG
ncbi:hypothetical protein [Nocardia sp. alder85J]|uniref:hypothetical protein n=1 Tax=Nocardia sp. alder85J TaxID=2862949 RepID=UPI001CD44049|nr:hypothetical protein [Nocardia sp. alder85J]MCX4095129.1 hypothetical protein [Nocardia sp. alder85J]